MNQYLSLYIYLSSSPKWTNTWVYISIYQVVLNEPIPEFIYLFIQLVLNDLIPEFQYLLYLKDPNRNLLLQQNLSDIQYFYFQPDESEEKYFCKKMLYLVWNYFVNIQDQYFQFTLIHIQFLEKHVFTSTEYNYHWK